MLESVDDPSKYLSSSGRPTHSLHIFSVFIACPDADHIMVCEAESPVISEIPRCSGLPGDPPIRKIKRRIERKFWKLRIAVRKDRRDHIGIFLVDFSHTRSVEILDIGYLTVLTIIGKYRICLEELEQGDFPISESESESVVVTCLLQG